MNICVGGELDGQVIEKEGRLLKALISIQVSQQNITNRFLTATTLIIILASNRIQLARNVKASFDILRASKIKLKVYCKYIF